MTIPHLESIPTLFLSPKIKLSMKLYTRHGDAGQTSLVGGMRVMKDDVRIVVCGDLDELNAHIGLLMSFGVPQCIADELSRVQELLFYVGAELSNPDFAMTSHLMPTDISQLEQAIDRLQQATPDPNTFILPTGCSAAAESHVCRTVARRAERSMVAMSHGYHVEAILLQFINRLSDYFFVLALYLNFITSIDEKKLYISCR